MNTSTGVTLVVGIGLIINVFDSFSFDFFFVATFFRGVLRSDDLKLPFRGNLIIHDGGTMMFACMPANGKQTGTQQFRQYDRGKLLLLFLFHFCLLHI